MNGVTGIYIPFLPTLCHLKNLKYLLINNHFYFLVAHDEYIISELKVWKCFNVQIVSDNLSLLAPRGYFFLAFCSLYIFPTIQTYYYCEFYQLFLLQLCIIFRIILINFTLFYLNYFQLCDSKIIALVDK